MRVTKTVLGAGLAAILAGACASTQTGTDAASGGDGPALVRPNDQAAIRAAYVEMAAALAECDFDAYAEHVRAGATLWYASDPGPTREDITDQETRDACTPGDMRFDLIQIDFAGPAAIVHGRATFQDPLDGAAYARFSETWTRQAGRWLLSGGMAMWDDTSDIEPDDDARARAAEAAEE